MATVRSLHRTGRTGQGLLLSGDLAAKIDALRDALEWPEVKADPLAVSRIAKSLVPAHSARIDLIFRTTVNGRPWTTPFDDPQKENVGALLRRGTVSLTYEFVWQYADTIRATMFVGMS